MPLDETPDPAAPVPDPAAPVPDPAAPAPDPAAPAPDPAAPVPGPAAAGTNGAPIQKQEVSAGEVLGTAGVAKGDPGAGIDLQLTATQQAGMYLAAGVGLLAVLVTLF